MPNIINKYSPHLYLIYIFNYHLNNMHNNNRKLDFERVSEVFKSRLVINKGMHIINEEFA